MFNQASSKRRQRSTYYKDMRLMNRTEETHLRQTLDHLDCRYRIILTVLSRERDSLVKDHQKLLNLRVCEPRATIDNTMREITETRKASLDLLHLASTPPTSQKCRLLSSKSLPHQRAEFTLNSRRSKSAHPFGKNSRDSRPPTGQEEEQKTACPSPLRPKSTVTFSTQATNRRARESESQMLSIMQLRHMATIDSISEKEQANQREHVRQEKERLKLLLRQKLSQKIKTFLRKLDIPETRLDN